ncbi:glycosyl transferase family 2 [Flavobacterium cyanobacteriorum]|uniref:Glycosyl transferase family 2 n=1 Tax=Flavobacterium cyanobacteriorum TaxID=2022802 RepID=A0A255ZPS8_9FLAO|nr:glycosyltransferase family 2 protein [Flavobacterium cyanobacteriorum]OYQ43402.1 glycosyl transferase family 2 [Flavobacterium cyanobacteriorum]
MQLSVIILNYNVRWFLQQCLLSVQKALSAVEGEIIVVDNNSDDDSCAMVKQYFPEATLIENKENAGFPKGNNIGVAAAKGKYICILNPDTVVAEDTFTKLLAFAETEPHIGITGVKMIDGTGHFLPESKRGVPSPWVAVTKIAGLYKLFPAVSLFNKYYAQHLPENQTGRADILSGACMLMRRELYLSVGGFDEDCFMYSDDIDLSYTVLKKGWHNYYFSGTSIIHYKGESTVKDGTYMMRFREAMQFFYKKHFRSSPLFDGFMAVGATFFALAKKNKKVEPKLPEYYILFSKNEGLRQTLEGLLQKKVVRIAQYEHNVVPSQDKGAEVILDNDMFSFGEIIAIMEKNKKCVTFKIKPAGYNYIIGSNSSNDRGQVISW